VTNNTRDTLPILWITDPVTGRISYQLDTLRLREEMVRAGKNRKDIQVALGMQQSAISYMCNGHRQPSQANLVRLAELLGLPDSRLLLRRQAPDAICNAPVQDEGTDAA